MAAKEARARIKINELLKDAGWRFFDEGNKVANIQVETNVKLSPKQISDMGDNFNKTKNGFIDFLLLDDKGKPIIVLEAKSEDKDPLVGKEQARDYAKSLFVRFVILSNGNLHYFWNIQKGNPQVVTAFPSFESLQSSKAMTADITKLYSEQIDVDYIALTQMPRYMDNPDYKDNEKHSQFIEDNNLRFLRPYQIEAMKSLQLVTKKGGQRFLFEMATGTGKTLTSAAVIKLFLRTGTASRVLFLVDRLELENQALKNFKAYLKNDYQSVIYKEHPDDWRKAEIVVSTVQTLMSNNRYKKIFKPTDFDLIISDEAHRSISGNNRAVFEYFLGYKLGLTATPKDYIKNVDINNIRDTDPRAWEKRQLLDTYKTFGCESSDPTFRYSLIDGVHEGYLINPIVVDARTDITTQLLSEKGYAVMQKLSDDVDDENQAETETYFARDFEKNFFSVETNRIFVKAFLENAKRDPLTGEIGKSIIFCVSRKHACKITQILNEFADSMFPDKYQSDFALQITSDIANAQQFTINFQNNNLRGTTAFLENYKSSKTRVCVTVGMMTTGYDCEDILNIGMLRPIFSPTDFVQIKGRGTRTFTFKYNERVHGETIQHKIKKDKFKLFDFFGNVEYFENGFNYDEVIKLPKGNGKGFPLSPPPSYDPYNSTIPDPLSSIIETTIGFEGMKIDRKLYEKFEEKVKDDDFVREQYESGNVVVAENYILNEIFNKPNEFFNMEKLRRAIGVDRRVSLREILDKIFGAIPAFKSKAELISDEFDAYLLTNSVSNQDYYKIRRFFETYLADRQVARIIDDKRYALLNAESGSYTFEELKQLGMKNMELIIEYIKDNVNVAKLAS